MNMVINLKPYKKRRYNNYIDNNRLVHIHVFGYVNILYVTVKKLFWMHPPLPPSEILAMPPIFIKY